MFSLKRKTEQEVIAEIHNEFDTAQEKLLAEATKIISQSNGTEIGDLHSRLGFVNAPAAKMASIIKGDMQTAKQTAELVNYYMVNYPFQKFLTEEQLDTICEKYGLIHAPIANYVKDVPEKNLRDIENAKVLVDSHSQGVVCKYTFKLRYDHQKDAFNKFVSMFGNVFTENEITGVYIKAGLNRNDYPSSNTDCVYYITSYSKLFSNYAFADCTVEKTDKSGLFIAAPKSHFNLKGLNAKGKYGFKHVFVQEVKDPIVFRYCKGGIQVITKWGLEAQDELVQNPIEN